CASSSAPLPGAARGGAGAARPRPGRGWGGAGPPLLSHIGPSLLSPPIRLLTLLTGPPSYFQLELYAVAHFVVAGIGMLVLGREIGLPILPASLGAIVFMFSGFFWAPASHLTILHSSAWTSCLVALQ